MEQNPIVGARARRSCRSTACRESRTSSPSCRERTLELGVALEDTAYVGNDINDAECLRAVGVPVVPADAWPEVKPLARWVLSRAGGDGCVREFCDAVWEAQRCMTDLFSLEGRVAVVTGGAGQLGGEIARGLAARGAKVAIFDIAEAAEARRRQRLRRRRHRPRRDRARDRGAPGASRMSSSMPRRSTRLPMRRPRRSGRSRTIRRSRSTR